MLFNLKKGLDEEHRALDTYKKLISQLHGEDSRIVELISRDEERHIKIVEELIKIANERFVRL